MHSTRTRATRDPTNVRGHSRLGLASGCQVRVEFTLVRLGTMTSSTPTFSSYDLFLNRVHTTLSFFGNSCMLSIGWKVTVVLACAKIFSIPHEGMLQYTTPALAILISFSEIVQLVFSVVQH